MARDVQSYRDELTGLSEGILFRRLAIPELDDPEHECRQVRQERTFPRLSGAAVVQRFLSERGVVELLQREDTDALFKESHWCVQQIDRLASEPPDDLKGIKAVRLQALRHLSSLESAEEELFIANRRLIAACAKPFYWIGDVWLADFLQEGAKALTNAIRKFDYTRGTPFYSYAQISVQNRMRNYFRDHVRAGSLNLRPTEEMMRIKQVKDRWVDEMNEAPPPEVLAKMCGIALDRVVKLMPMIRQWERMPSAPVSLDALVGESTTSLHELIEDTRGTKAFDSLQHSEIRTAMTHLPERSAAILRMRFIEGQTLEETGIALDLTRARIKQIQDEALRKLRVMLSRDGE